MVADALIAIDATRGPEMDEVGIQLRVATPDDVSQIKQSIRVSLANPEGRPQRKRYQDAADRRELMVLARFDPKDRVDHVLGFIEWHSRVDNGVTIRDMGVVGDDPQPATLRRLLRELLSLLSPPMATVKLREDLTLWNTVFEETPGFVLEGREYSRPYWRRIYTWTEEDERISLQASRRNVPARPRQRRPA
jgi:hypothetical protein